MADKRERVENEIDVAELKKLLDEATSGPWYIDRGLMADSLNITAYERERSRFSPYGREKRDGPICHVSTERQHFHVDKDHFGNHVGESRSWKTPIHKAQADAKLIVAAVNALPELLRRLKLDVDETGWLIERPADKYGPVRWWAAGEEQFVISANDATRLARKADAEAIIRANGLKGAGATEHMWFAPKKR